MYGENAGNLRTELTTLLRQRRIQQRLGGPGIHTVPETTTLEDQLFNRVDTRLAEVIEHGVSKRVYFLRVKLPRIVDQSVGLVQPQRVRYAPINSPAQSDLIEIVRARLRPPPIQPRPPTGARQSRLDFQAAIVHRPDGRETIGL